MPGKRSAAEWLRRIEAYNERYGKYGAGHVIPVNQYSYLIEQAAAEDQAGTAPLTPSDTQPRTTAP